MTCTHEERTCDCPRQQLHNEKELRDKKSVWCNAMFEHYRNHNASATAFDGDDFLHVHVASTNVDYADCRKFLAKNDVDVATDPPSMFNPFTWARLVAQRCLREGFSFGSTDYAYGVPHGLVRPRITLLGYEDYPLRDSSAVPRGD